MLPPYVVEEHDNAFWVHHQGYFDFETRKRVMGELAYDKSFDTHDKAQLKANSMIMKKGCLF